MGLELGGTTSPPAGAATRRVPAGGRGQPWAQFPRRAARLPRSSTYSQLAASLTAASGPSLARAFPAFLGAEQDGSGTGETGDLGSGGYTPCGPPLGLSPSLSPQPMAPGWSWRRWRLSVSTCSPGTGPRCRWPAPSTCLSPWPPTPLLWWPLVCQPGGLTPRAVSAGWGVAEEDTAPAGGGGGCDEFEGVTARCVPTGLWVRNGTGLIRKEGPQLYWTFVSSQLGYWAAALPSPSTGKVTPVGALPACVPWQHPEMLSSLTPLSQGCLRGLGPPWGAPGGLGAPRAL